MESRESVTVYLDSSRQRENEDKIKEEVDPNYERIRSYLILLRAPVADQKDIGDNFFKNHKNEKTVYENLNKITDNLKEKDDVRIQATVLLKKLYNVTHKYIKYEKIDGNNQEEHDDVIMTNSQNALASEEMLMRNSNSNNKNHKRMNPLIDSLSYIDGKYKEEIRVKDEMNRLIKEEMCRLATVKTLEDYLENATTPLELKYVNDPVIQKEIEKEKKLNISNQEINTKFEHPPPNKYHDLQYWGKLVNNVNVSAQQINIKNLNLDLLVKFGPTAWKKYLNAFECTVAQLENEKTELEKHCEEINVEFGGSVNEMESKLNYHINQFSGIQTECLKLKYKIKKLIKYKKSKLKAKGKIIAKVSVSK